LLLPSPASFALRALRAAWHAVVDTTASNTTRPERYGTFLSQCGAADAWQQQSLLMLGSNCTWYLVWPNPSWQDVPCKSLKHVHKLY
jgi:hypothetical protein